MAKAITDRVGLPGGVVLLIETEDGDELFPGVQRLTPTFVYDLQLRAYEQAVAEQAAEQALEDAKQAARDRRAALLAGAQPAIPEPA